MERGQFQYRGSQLTSIPTGGEVREVICDQCGALMTEKKATPEAPYNYEISGLKDIFLSGILVHVCPKCKAESAIIPKLAELHWVITKNLVERQELLKGREIRFLRKNVGLAACKFAALLGVSPSHLSRIENGKTFNLSETADKLARVIIMTANENENSRDILNHIAQNVIKQKRAKQHVVFKLEKNYWKQVA